MQRRRVMLAAAKDPFEIGTLKYWWCGKDAPVNNIWKARVGNFPWSLSAGTLYDSEANLYDFGAGTRYAVNSNMNSIEFAFGHHFRLVFDIDLKFDGTASTFVDFGSIEQSEHAIGFTIKEIDGHVVARVNWKLKGNNSNPGLGYDSLLPAGDTSLFQHFKGYFEVVDKGNGYDKCAVRINEVKYTWPVNVPKAAYGPTWDKSNAYLGRGVNANYNSNVKIRDLKIYQID